MLPSLLLPGSVPVERGGLGLSRQFLDPILVRADKQFLAIGDAEFIKDASEVMTDCNARDAKAVGDVFV